MGLANLSEKCYSSMLVNEFYFGILIHAKENKNPVRFRYNVLYMYFDAQERVIIEFDFGKLLGCEHYGDLYEASNHYPSDNIWDTLAKEPECKKIALNLAAIPAPLHHFYCSV